MRKEVDLIEYFPHFMREYKEVIYITEAENPEFQRVWDECERTLKNQYIQTCDEVGIARYEKMLKIIPSENDTLASRVSRVFVRWNEMIPYTWKIFLRKLDSLCGVGNYDVIPNFNEYHLTIITHLEVYGQIDELENLLDYMLPANLTVELRNELSFTSGASIHFPTYITHNESYELK